ncbi:unnamed protein product [Allacma fusca]|uniref:Uncharacterized protein n=1 Tax=Allacma fusca TaxID=39272 RepID=A0A8J2KUP6_9HEXA|nr:unnamed protein product [Allacma fusca]
MDIEHDDQNTRPLLIITKSSSISYSRTLTRCGRLVFVLRSSFLSYWMCPPEVKMHRPISQNHFSRIEIESSKC